MFEEGRIHSVRPAYVHPRRRTGASDRLACAGLACLALQSRRLAPGASRSSSRPCRLIGRRSGNLSAQYALIVRRGDRDDHRFCCHDLNADLRPQSYGLLGFTLLLALARGRLPFWLKLLAAFRYCGSGKTCIPRWSWALALGGLAAADFLNALARSWEGEPPGEPLRNPARTEPRPPRITRGCLDPNDDHARAWEQFILALLAMASQFATPLGVRILDVSRDNLRISRDVLHNPEWVPPWDPAVASDAVQLYWLALFARCSRSYGSGACSCRDRAFFVVMTLLSLYASRFIILWAVTLVPLWAELVERLVPRNMFVWPGLNDLPLGGVRSALLLSGVLLVVINLHPTRFGPIFRPEITDNGVRALRRTFAVGGADLQRLWMGRSAHS